MKTELRQKSRLIVFLFLTITAMGARAQAQFTINNPSSLGTQSVGQVEFGLTTSNGIGPYTWTLESGALPDGVSIRTLGVAPSTAARLCSALGAFGAAWAPGCGSGCGWPSTTLVLAGGVAGGK